MIHSTVSSSRSCSSPQGPTKVPSPHRSAPGFPQNTNHVRKEPGVWRGEAWEPWGSLLPGNHLFEITEKTHQSVKRMLTENTTRSANSPPPPACRCVCLSLQAHCPCILVRTDSGSDHVVQMVSSLIWKPHSPTFGLFRPETTLFSLALFENTE